MRASIKLNAMAFKIKFAKLPIIYCACTEIVRSGVVIFLHCMST